MSDKDIVLPEGWITSPIGECLEIHYGKGLPKKNRKDGNVPVYGSNGIVGHHNKAYTNQATIVIGRKGSVGKIHLSEIPCWPIDTTYFIDDFSCFTPAFTKYALNQLDLEGLESSSAIPGINRDRIYELECRIPPLAEQKRIVAKVETLLTSVDKVRTRLDRIPDLLKRFRQSILAAAVSGKLTEDWREENDEIASTIEAIEKSHNLCREQYSSNCKEAKKKGKRKPTKPTCLDAHEIAWNLEGVFPDKWTIRALGSVCSKITDGTHDTPKTQQDGFPYITAKHIREGAIDFDNCAFLSNEDHQIVYSRCNPEKGDVLMVNIGAGTATSALVDVDYEFSMKNVALLKPLSGLLNGHYLEYNLRFMKDSIFKNITRGGAQPFLGLNLIKTLPIILPPHDEQEEIVRRVEQVFQLADKLEAHYKKAKQAVDKLTQSILAKALRGELVPTEAELARQEGRSYETAEALLTRIHEELAQRRSEKKMGSKSAKQERITMKKLDRESVQKTISSISCDTFSFDELRKKLPGDYDALKDMLFAMLEDANSALEQVFDEQTKTMRFRWGEKV